jgi:hypothetical protein
MSDAIRLGVVRASTFGLLDPPDVFMPQARDIGASAARVTIYWSQVEPEPGRFVWDAVDAFLAQLIDGDEAWIQVGSSSPWATVRRATTWFLPPSPALDIDQYRRFIGELVRHCRGRVRLWQCENEPCTPLLWSGTAAEYVAHLAAFHDAVKAADPAALVVLGGAPPSAIDVPRVTWPNPAAVAIFDEILRDAVGLFDVLDVHMYGNPYAIPAIVAACRERMTASGYQVPIVVGEYNGPMPFDFPEVFPHLGPAMATLTEQASGDQAAIERAGISFANPQGIDEPAIDALYTRMDELPPALQMFMVGCTPELEARRARAAARDLVIRNVLAASAGVRRTMCFQFAPDGPFHNGRHVMDLLFGKFLLFDYEGGSISRRYPAADALALVARLLAGVDDVRRIEIPDRPEVYAYELVRDGRDPTMVAWERHDGFGAEDEPATRLTLDWPAPTATAVDCLGAAVSVSVRSGHVELPVSATPLFLSR